MKQLLLFAVYPLLPYLFSTTDAEMIKLIAIFSISLSLFACSQKSVYEGIQAGERNACLKEPESQYDDCMQRANKSYDEYKRERDEALK